MIHYSYLPYKKLKTTLNQSNEIASDAQASVQKQKGKMLENPT